jgi:hypothetical protein
MDDVAYVVDGKYIIEFRVAADIAYDPHEIRFLLRGAYIIPLDARVVEVIEIIQPDNLVSEFEQFIYGVTSDESRGAGYKNRTRHSFLPKKPTLTREESIGKSYRWMESFLDYPQAVTDIHRIDIVTVQNHRTKIITLLITDYFNRMGRLDRVDIDNLYPEFVLNIGITPADN